MPATKTATTATSDWPEHEKLHALEGQNEVVGDFIEWLKAEGFVLMTPQYAGGSTLTRSRLSTQDLLARYFGINQRTLEAEKRAMLEALRQTSSEVIAHKMHQAKLRELLTDENREESAR